MTTEHVLWIVGQVIVVGGASFAAYLALVQRIARLESKVADVDYVEMIQRVSKIEAVLDTFGKDMARRLHRDDDIYHADKLLETYINRSYEMSLEEWKALELVCEKVLANPGRTHSEDIGYRFLKALAKHKLTIRPPNL